MPIYAIFLQQGGRSSACTFAQSDQLLFRCLDEHMLPVEIVNMVAKPLTQFYSLSDSCVFLFDGLTVIQINNVHVFFKFRLLLWALFNLQMLNTHV